jgi:DNA-binding MarR family transcriptional regulator
LRAIYALVLRFRCLNEEQCVMGKKPSAKVADQIITNIPIVVRGMWNHWQDQLPIKFTWSQFGLLDLLSQESHTLTELSREWGVSKPSMSKMVEWQVDRGWVVRKADPKDHRRKPLHLTPSGRQVHEEARAVIRRNLVRALEQLDDEQSAQIVSALDLLVQILT